MIPPQLVRPRYNKSLWPDQLRLHGRLVSLGDRNTVAVASAGHSPTGGDGNPRWHRTSREMIFSWATGTLAAGFIHNPYERSAFSDHGAISASPPNGGKRGRAIEYPMAAMFRRGRLNPRYRTLPTKTCVSSEPFSSDPIETTACATGGAPAAESCALTASGER